MHSPIVQHCDKSIASPLLDTIRQERKGTPDQQQFDQYSS